MDPVIGGTVLYDSLRATLIAYAIGPTFLPIFHIFPCYCRCFVIHVERASGQLDKSLLKGGRLPKIRWKKSNL